MNGCILLNKNVYKSKKTHKYEELKLCCWFRKKVKLGKMKGYH